jgi:hypothetical protein
VKKKENSFGEHIPSVSLFRDDLKEVVDIVSRSGRMKISDRDHEYDSLEELQDQVGNRPPALSIQCYSPWVSLTLDRRDFGVWSHLYADAEGKLHFHDIKAILLRRTRWFNWVLNRSLAVICLLAILLAIVAIPAQQLKNGLAGFRVTAWVFVLLFLVGYPVLTFLTRWGFFYRLDLRKRHEAPTFWKENRSKILLAVIAASVGVVAKGIWDKLMK